jgi:hypothetical protein
MLLRLFQEEVTRQCENALAAAAEIDACLQKILAPGRPAFELIPAFWRAAQALVVSAANVSKALWGAGGKYTEERRPLRESLDVADDSPFRPTRFRNHFEHFDERLDTWWRESTNHNIAVANIGARGSSIGGLEVKEMFRQYDPDTDELIFWGEVYPLGEVVAGLQRLARIAAREAAKPHWPT